jgi:hypothetical protein
MLCVLAPRTITPDMLVSSTAVETEYPAWTSGATFANGAFCVSTTTHRVYQSQIDGNIGKDPTDPLNRAGSTVYWLDYGPTNRWAMFDNKVSTQTALPSPLTVVLRPGAFSASYLVGLDAETVSLTIRDAPGGNVIYTYSGSLEASAPADYDEYFFDPFSPVTDLLLTGIGQYTAGEVTMTLAKASGTVKCGSFALGDIRELGHALADAEAEPVSFSYVDIDRWGNSTIVPGPKCTNLAVSAVTESREQGRVAQAVVASLLDVAAFWFCSDRQDTAGLRAFGLGSGKFSYRADRCNISITVKGLI